jgi:hypothetical protein
VTRCIAGRYSGAQALHVSTAFRLTEIERESARAEKRAEIYESIRLRRAYSQRPFKIGCEERSLALHSMHESAFRFAGELCTLLCLCALGRCSVRFLFWRPILSVVRLLRLPRLLRLLSELLQLRVGRLLSALVAAPVLRRILWRVGRTRMGRWLAWRTRRLAWRRLERRTRLAWRRRARSPLIRLDLKTKKARQSFRAAGAAYPGRPLTSQAASLASSITPSR